jgi:hypothetical protein
LVINMMLSFPQFRAVVVAVLFRAPFVRGLGGRTAGDGSAGVSTAVACAAGGRQAVRSRIIAHPMTAR